MMVARWRRFASRTPLAWFGALAQAQAPDAAQDYPRKAIRIIIEFTPGGGPDITARWIARKLTDAWKQQVMFDNLPLRQRWLAIGLEPRPTTPGEFDRIIADQIATFTGIARAANI
jgi:hypothetical protein